jgi:hypothetical protein
MDVVKYLPPSTETLDARLKRLDKPGEHLWVMTGAWHIANPDSAYDPAQIKLMDRENLVVFAGPGCFKCEKPYSKAMSKRRCNGNVNKIQ